MSEAFAEKIIDRVVRPHERVSIANEMILRIGRFHSRKGAFHPKTVVISRIENASEIEPTALRLSST